MSERLKKIENKRKNRPWDAKDDMIDKLWSLNIKLKKRLKMLNSVVEKAIDKTDTKRILLSNKQKVDPEKVSRVRD